MNIEERIKALAQSEPFAGYSYVFDEWKSVDTALDRVALPAIVNILPLQGEISKKNGRFRDMEYVQLAFLDKVMRDANGEDNAAVYNRMKRLGMRFLEALNATGDFEPFDETLEYNVICEGLSPIVTGVLFIFQLTEKWHCEDWQEPQEEKPVTDEDEGDEDNPNG